MKYSLQENSTAIEYSTLVETIWACEKSRDFELSISTFKSIWDDIDIDPDFSQFSRLQQAELYRLSGYLVSNYGKFKNRLNYQERGKNLLTKAIEIYSGFSKFLEVAEAQNALSMCYYFEGAIREAEAILEQTANDFLSDKLHLIYLQNRANLLITKHYQKKYEEALEIIEEITVPMEFCEDKRSCAVFHEKAGILFKRLKQYNKAVYHYQKATKYAEEVNNFLFIGSYKNNLANVYRLKGEFALAHSNQNEAIEIANLHKQTGWLPHYLDTKALIYFDEGNSEAALVTINEAISIFEKGEDAGGLTEAIWNKCRFLLYLNRKEEAIKLFAKLAPLASERIGEFAVDDFSKEFADLIHVKLDGSLDEETKRFRRIEIITAIRKAKYEMGSAADSLKISLAQLNTVIDEEFPELYEEINIERFAALDRESAENIQSTQHDISRLFLQDDKFSIETGLTGKFSTFYIAGEKMTEAFGILQDAVIYIEPVCRITADEHILVHNKLNGVYSIGKVHYDKTFDLYFLLDKDEPKPLSLDEVDLIGRAVAYFPFSEIDNEEIKFKPLKF